MKKCNKCGQQNNQDSLFCEACGNNLSQQGENNVPLGEGICASCGLQNDKESVFCIKCGANLKQKKSNESTKDYKANAVKIGNDAVRVGAGVVNKFKSKVKSDKKFAMITAVIAVVVGVFLFSSIFISSEKKVLLGLSKMMKSETNEATITLSVDSKIGVDEIDDILEETKVKIAYYTDLKDREFKFEGSLLLNRKSLFDVNFATQEEAVYIELPKTYDDYFYVETDEEYAQIMDEYIQFIGYFTEVDLDRLTKGEYRDVIIDKLSDCTEKKDGKIVVEMSTVDALEILEDICSIAKSDEKLAKDLYGSLEKINSKIKKDKFKPESAEIEELVDVMDEFISDSSEEEFVDDMLESLESVHEFIEEYIEDADDFYFTFEFDMGMFNKIKSIKTIVDVEGVELAVEMDLTKGADKPKYSTKKGVDIVNISDSKAEKIGREIVENLLERLSDNRDVKNLLEDSEWLEWNGYDSVDELIEELIDDLIDDLYNL